MKKLSYNFWYQLIAALLFIFSAAGQHNENAIVINITQKQFNPAAPEIPAEIYLNGFKKYKDGQKINYHSSLPDAETALLVRARREVQAISWETDTLPRTWNGKYYNFIWLAGIEKAGWSKDKPPHKFDFFINDELWFSFRNLRDSSAYLWTVKGRDESELSFKSLIEDKFGDLFGYMFLRVPKRSFTAGTPLVCKVVGEDADSPDWFMTFQYNFNFTPGVRSEPALIRKGENVKQVLRISVDNLTDGREIEITVPRHEAIRQQLNIGSNIFMLPIDAVTVSTEASLTFKINGELNSHSTVLIKPVPRRDIYLLSYSHNDIGYTDLQQDVEKKQMKNLRDALELIKKTKDYPPEAQYRWNMENIWALESFMKWASEENKQEAIEAIRNGHLGLNALYANLLTGLANDVEMTHFTEYARRFSKEFSLQIMTACVSDIPGFTWGLVTALAHSGVKYFSSAPNSGDRVGYVYEALGDKPFYWTSQSGEEKVLLWLAAASYSSFHEGNLSMLGDEKILKMMRKLDETGYLYDMVKLPYTIGGDNGPPDSTLSGFVKKWNGKYVSPRLIIATHEQIFTEFEKRYGSALPTMKGDFTPYWEDGAASTAYETALNRRAADRLIQSEVIWSMHSSKPFPDSEYYAAWRNIVMYDEHTWGAHNSITDPDSSFVKGQWEIKKRFALDADSISQALLVKGITEPVAKNRGAVDIYNTNSWMRSDVVLVSKEQSTAGDLVIDESGKIVPSQRLSTGELAIFADHIPPLSLKRFFIRQGNPSNSGKARANNNILENDFFSIKISRASGSVESLIWKINGAQLVKSGKGLNEYFYVHGKNPDSARHLSDVKVYIKEKGGLVASLLVEGKAPGCKRYTVEYRIFNGIERLDIIDHLDKSAVREKEAVHFGFPFNIPDGKLRYDVAYGIVQPEIDQLLGSCKNFFSVQNFVDISNNSYGITWSAADAPLIEIGTINAEKPWMKTIEPSSTIYSYVMNNYWHTNYKADQEGLVIFHYSIRPHSQYKSDDAVRSGREQREPLIVTNADPDKRPASPLFTIEPSEILVSSCRPVKDGWHIKMYNASHRSRKMKIYWNKRVPVSIHASDIDGNAFDEIKKNLMMPPYSSRYILVIRK